MPLARITMIKGKSPEYLAALSQAVHASLVEAYGMDDRDRFQIIEEVEAGRLIFSRDYAGGPRSGDLILIGIESMPRTKEMKEAFYKRLVEHLGKAPGVRPEDVFVCLSDRLAFGGFLVRQRHLRGRAGKAPWQERMKARSGTVGCFRCWHSYSVDCPAVAGTQRSLPALSNWRKGETGIARAGKGDLRRPSSSFACQPVITP